MTLHDLKFRALLVFVTTLVLLFLQAFRGVADGFTYLIASIGSLALVMWMAATVADATVKSLKKEK